MEGGGGQEGSLEYVHVRLHMCGDAVSELMILPLSRVLFFR